MPAYLTHLQLRDDWLTPDSRAASTTTQLSNAVTNASALVDSKLAASGYNLPLVSVGNSVTSAVGAIAAWYLETTIGLIPEGESNVEKRAKRAMEWLDDLVRGRARLVDSADTPVVTVASNGPGVISEPLRGW
jgi:phage gp36-like protein